MTLQATEKSNGNGLEFWNTVLVRAAEATEEYKSSLTDARNANGLRVQHANALQLPHEHISTLKGLLQSSPPLLGYTPLFEGIHGLQYFPACFLLLQTMCRICHETFMALLSQSAEHLSRHLCGQVHAPTRDGGARLSSMAALSRYWYSFAELSVTAADATSGALQCRVLRLASCGRNKATLLCSERVPAAPLWIYHEHCIFVICIL